MKIFVMRHGHRADDPTNPAGVQMPPGRPLDPDLSSIGIEMARQTGEFLHDAGIQFIYASPFLRTTHTAAKIAERLKLPIRLDWGFGEHFVPQWFSEWPGTTAPQELARRFPMVDPYYPQTGVMPTTSESYWEMHDRAMRATEVIVDRHRRANVLIVSHAAIACTIPPGLTSWTGWQPNPQLCAITSLTRESAGWKVDYNGRTDHLKVVRT